MSTPEVLASAAPVATKSISESAVFTGIKLLDIGYVAILYFALGLILAKLMDYFYGKFDQANEAKKPTHRILLEAAGMLWLNGVMVYFVRNIVSMVPFPLNGIYGFDHLKVKELANATVFVYAYLYFQKSFKAKMQYIYNNIISTPPPPRPALSRQQLMVINRQIQQQITRQRIQDRETIKVIQQQAITQALAKAVSDARVSEARRARAQTELAALRATQAAEADLRRRQEQIFQQ